MLLVNTFVGASPIEGVGVFASDPIPKGTLIWRLEPDFDRLIPFHAEHMDRHFDHVLKHRHVLPQIEALKDHAKLRTNPGDLLHIRWCRVPPSVSSHLYCFSMDGYISRIRDLQQVDTAKKRALA